MSLVSNLGSEVPKVWKIQELLQVFVLLKHSYIWQMYLKCFKPAISDSQGL